MVEKDDSGGQMRTGEGDRLGMMLVWAKRVRSEWWWWWWWWYSWRRTDEWWMQQVKEMKWRWVICVKGYGLHTQSGLTLGCHSQALSRYRTTRGLLPAGFPPSAGSPLLRRPGQPDLRQTIHIGAVLSVDTRSTCTSKHQFSRSREIPHPGLQVARLQAHATTPSQPYHTYSTNSLLLLPLLLLPLQLQQYHNINNTNKLNLIKYNRSNQTQTSLQQTP